jgi:predicted dehydrogenase
MAVIGTGTRGLQVWGGFSQHSDCVFLAACDVDKTRLDAAVQKMGGKLDAYGDYRRILERKDVDAVLIATPDHWHSPMMVEACAAGKDVYVEKPVSNTLPAAQRMVEAARKSKSIVQVGLQQRSWPHFQECVKMIQDGLLGNVTHAVLIYPGGYTRAQQPPEPPPPTLDWEMWQGPAPRRPYSPSRRGWRAFYAYGGGLVTDWGVHLTDIAHMALGCDATGPSLTNASAQYVNVPRDEEQVPDAFVCSWQYEKFVMSFTNINPPGGDFPASGNYFYGQRGVVLLNRTGYRITPAPSRGGAGRGPGGAAAAQPGRAPGGFGGPPAGPPIEAKEFRSTARGAAGADEGTVLHTRNFLDCVKSRRKPNCDMETGFYSTLPCLIALLAIQQRRSFLWDGKSARPV